MTKLISTWQEFAEITIKTNDLDPMYSVIAGLNKYKSRDWMGRFIMYFLLFYDAGGAARMADSISDKDFWVYIKSYAAEPSTKRGTERRHFRGENARKAIEKLSNRPINQPWSVLMHMYNGTLFEGYTDRMIPERSPRTYTQLYSHMTSAYAGTQFGPYFIWKLYDIFNVCLGMPISLSLDEAVKYMPDEPKKSAAHFFPMAPFRDAVFAVNEYIEKFDHPVREGKCGLAEAETILCMMKGFFKTKTHTIGDDIDEKLVQLREHPELANLLPLRVTDQYAPGELK